jgi:hypothetical protein
MVSSRKIRQYLLTGKIKTLEDFNSLKKIKPYSPDWIVKNILCRIRSMRTYKFSRCELRDECGKIDRYTCDIVCRKDSHFERSTKMCVKIRKNVIRSLIKIGWIYKYNEYSHSENDYGILKAHNMIETFLKIHYITMNSKLPKDLNNLIYLYYSEKSLENKNKIKQNIVVKKKIRLTKKNWVNFINPTGILY